MYHSNAMRRLYAALFNVSDYLVCWWDELTPEQRGQAMTLFSNYNMDGYAYQLGIDGTIMARHERCAHDRPMVEQSERPEFPHGEFDNGGHWRGEG